MYWWLAYAVGGWTKTTNEAYDPSTNTWSTKADMPTARTLLPAAAAINNMLYVCGGYDGSKDLALNEAYDPSTNTWSTKADMPTARHSFAVGVIDGTLYAVGGYAGSGRLALNEAYDPSTNRWSVRADMPVARREIAGGVIDGLLYVIGGSTSPTNTNEAYDPKPKILGIDHLLGWLATR